jgi:hypothetical protein
MGALSMSAMTMPTSATATMTTRVTTYQAADRQNAMIEHTQLGQSIPLYKEWQARAIKAALDLVSIPETWERSGQVRPTPGAIERALEMIRLAGNLDLDDLREPFVLPLAGGGVQLEWEQADRRVEIELWNDGTLGYLQLEGGEQIPEGEGDLWPISQVKGLLGWLQAAR